MITLEKVSFENCVAIQVMQSKSFNELLVKYRDYKTNPAAEKLDVIQNKIKFSDYYFIVSDGKKVGVIRIIPSDNFCRISPVFILPEFQNQGYAQAAIKEAELLYPDIKEWHLDTIKQEDKLMHLYQKLGYKETGKEEFIQDGMDIVFLEKHIV